MRYPHAIWKGASSSDFSTRRITPRFFVVHVAQGGAAGTDSWFHNPSSQVSAHFLNPFDGPIHQYVDTDEEAFAEMAFNGVGISCEHEGFSGEHLNPNQMANLERLILWVNKVHRIPMKVRANAYGREGIVSHGSLGQAGGDHPDCPGAEIMHDVGVICNRLSHPLFRISLTR